MSTENYVFTGVTLYNPKGQAYTMYFDASQVTGVYYDTNFNCTRIFPTDAWFSGNVVSQYTHFITDNNPTNAYITLTGYASEYPAGIPSVFLISAIQDFAQSVSTSPTVLQLFSSGGTFVSETPGEIINLINAAQNNTPKIAQPTSSSFFRSAKPLITKEETELLKDVCNPCNIM